jgi:hypothetical protein
MMIEAKMVQWMVMTLDSHTRKRAIVSEYTTEYGTALLMNLVLWHFRVEKVYSVIVICHIYVGVETVVLSLRVIAYAIKMDESK